MRTATQVAEAMCEALESIIGDEDDEILAAGKAAAAEWRAVYSGLRPTGRRIVRVGRLHVYWHKRLD